MRRGEEIAEIGQAKLNLYYKFVHIQNIGYNKNMESSDNHLSNSIDFYNMKRASQNQLDENSMNKANTEVRPFVSKHELHGDPKSLASDLLKRIQQLQQKLNFLESKQVQCPRKKKKLRRRAKQIPRIYKCNFSSCGKEYGSEASLKNHRKLKHGIRLIRKSRPIKN